MIPTSGVKYAVARDDDFFHWIKLIQRRPPSISYLLKGATEGLF
jgi:hypothetical protein